MGSLTRPEFVAEAAELGAFMSGLSVAQLQTVMHISAKLADDTKSLLAAWSQRPSRSAAIETFRGDIYSGLRSLEFSEKERAFAQLHLRLLSGLYGILRPYDDVMPYRLEAGYRLPEEPYASVYSFWGEKLAASLPAEGPIVNLTSKEYEKLVLPYLDGSRVITPRFLSRINSGEPRFVAVHAKIARGAFARWLIVRGIDNAAGFEAFSDLGYHYEPPLSTTTEPVYICDDFKGLGLSQRLVA